MAITGLTGAPIHKGSWLGLPDIGLTELLQGKKTTTPTPAKEPTLIGKITDTKIDPNQPQPDPTFKPIIRPPQTNVPNQEPQPVNNNPGGDDRDRIQSEEDRALQAAIGVFEARKAGLMNRIPGLQNQLATTNKQYDENLLNFENEANREQTKRLGDLDTQEVGVNEQYTAAGRKTRTSAKALARQLKAMFAGRGSLDSTQYQDMSVDQSRDIIRSVGDMNREQAGKITSIGKEKEDVKGYYTEQLRAEKARVQLAKEEAANQTNDLIQGVLDDANLTDAQKVESVVAAQNRLSQRLADLDAREAQLAETRRLEDRDYALKVGELQNKQYSSSYKDAQNQNKAVKDAMAVVESYKSKFSPSSDQTYNFAQKVFTQFGLSPEEAEKYASFYGATGNGSSNEDEQITGLL